MTTESEATTASVESGAPARRRFDLFALAGIAATAFAFAGSAPEAPVDISASGLREHLSTAAGAWQSYALLMAVGAAALLVFVAHLRAVLVAGARASGRSTVLPDIVMGAGVACAMWLLVNAGATAVTAFADLSAIDDTALVAAWGLIGLGDYVGLAAFTVKGLTMVAAGIAILRTRVLGAWLGWLSVALGVITATALFVPVLFYPGLFAFPLWPLAVAIALIIRGLGRRGPAAIAV